MTAPEWHKRFGISLVVERFSFYRQLRGPTLRFAEHAPADAHSKEPFECGCTTNVSARPAGQPHEVQQEIYLRCPMPSQKVRAEFKLCSGWVTLWLDELLPEVAGGYTKSKARIKRAFKDALASSPTLPHAYFILGGRRPEADPHHARVEMTLPGYGFTDCFFSDVFIGRAETSRLMNGHSRSRIVDPSKLRSDDVWLHGCLFGHEAMRILPHDDVEASTWREIFGEAEWISRLAAPYEEDHHPVEWVLGAVEADEKLVLAAYHQVERLARIVSGLRGTQLYAAQDEIDRQTSEANAREREIS